MAAPVAAEAPGGAAWNDTRADLFAEVCMAAAPRFADVAERARAAGFDWAGESLVYPPEVEMALQGDGETCACSMVFGAPQPAALTATILAELDASFPGARGYSATAHVVPFTRGGTEVTAVLQPRRLEGKLWVLASVLAPGDCR